jgi:hypothetical protein
MEEIKSDPPKITPQMRAARERVYSKQAEIAEKAYDRDGPLFHLRSFIGPATTYTLIEDREVRDSRPLPWNDGVWADGIEIAGDSSKVTFDFNRCELQDAVAFLRFYTQTLIMRRESPVELHNAYDKLTEAIQWIITGKATKVGRDAIDRKIKFQGQEKVIPASHVIN